MTIDIYLLRKRSDTPAPEPTFDNVEPESNANAFTEERETKTIILQRQHQLRQNSMR